MGKAPSPGDSPPPAQLHPRGLIHPKGTAAKTIKHILVLLLHRDEQTPGCSQKIWNSLCWAQGQLLSWDQGWTVGQCYPQAGWAQRRDQEGTRGGLWQLCAAPGSCTTGASLQWPFKPDWKMLCTARLTKKRHFPSCGSSSGCLMSLNGWGGIAQHPRKAKQLNPCALLWKIRGIYNV